METRLLNTFISKNVTKLAKTILKSPYKFLLDTILLATLIRPVHFIWAVKFLATFNLEINILL